MTLSACTEVPTGSPSLGPTRSARGPLVFAVEDTTAQLTWQALTPSRSGKAEPTGGTVPHPARRSSTSSNPRQGSPALKVTASEPTTGRVVGTAWSDGGPGSIELHGLSPGTTQRVGLDLDGRPVGEVGLTTLRPLGRELSRFATLSDIHLGLDVFGVRGRMTEPPPTGARDESNHEVPANLRAASAALDELTEWGAQHLFIKGDLVDRSTPATWAMAGRLLTRTHPPTTVMTGNHEHNEAGIIAPHAGAASIGVDAVDGVRRVDLDGVRVLCIDTIRPRAHGGTVTDDVAEAAMDAADTATSPVMVLTHHPIERFNRAWSHPPGVPNHEGRELLEALANRCELLLVSAGHTHAHRRRTIAGVTTTEVGSPKDYPGVWAGYVVCEQGIRQVIRRVSSTQVRDWLHHTRLAAGGIWGRWSPGRLSDRSLQVRRG